MVLQKHTTQIEEHTVLKRAAAGDLTAFNQLVLDTQDMVYHHALTVLGDSAMAENAAQEGFIKAFQKVSTFRRGSVRGWLLKIVTNSAYDILRRSGRRPTRPLYPEDENGDEIETAIWLVDPNASVQVTVEAREDTQYLFKLLDELPKVHRPVITLVDLYEMDYEEAAKILSVPTGTIKSRLARARLLMQKKMQDGFDYIQKRKSVPEISLKRFNVLL